MYSDFVNFFNWLNEIKVPFERFLGLLILCFIMGCVTAIPTVFLSNLFRKFWEREQEKERLKQSNCDLLGVPVDE